MNFCSTELLEINQLYFQAYAAGYLEGYVTYELLHMHWVNTVDGYCKGKEELCQKILEHVNDNTEWVKYKIKHHRSSDAYWHQVCNHHQDFDLENNIL
jgi:hypothetical protein